MTPLYAVCRFGSWAMLRTLWRFRTIDAHLVPRSGPLIVACNHVSYLDPPALGVAAPRQISYMAKHELFAIPVLGPLIAGLGAFPVDRSRGDVAAIKSAATVLARGAALGIFPEGTRNLTGDVRAQMGVALLASRSGATVVPAYIDGSRDARRLRRITVVFGEPLRFEPGQKARRDALAKWTEELMARIYGLREKIT